MQFIGAIAFLDSTERENRVTKVMTFEVMTEWFNSVREYFTQEVLTGYYDGSEVLVTVYEYKREGIPTDWDYDAESVVGSVSISNPYFK